MRSSSNDKRRNPIPGGIEKASATPRLHTGEVYGRLTVLEPAPTSRNYARWWCRCTCGTRKAIPEPNLIGGRTISCGCLMRERNSARMRTHGLTQTRVYQAWLHMKQRCYYTGNRNYQNWGGRGIAVCDRWRDNFEAFLADVGERPSLQHSLDRIDPNGNYEPGNVCWRTHIEQRHNRRDVVLIEYQGRSQLLIGWARELHVQVGTLKQRLRHGWSVERTMTTPVRPKRHHRSPTA